MAGFFKSCGKAQHVYVALRGFLGQAFGDNLLHCKRDLGMPLAERRRNGIQVLVGELGNRPPKGSWPLSHS